MKAVESMAKYVSSEVCIYMKQGQNEHCNSVKQMFRAALVCV